MAGRGTWSIQEGKMRTNSDDEPAGSISNPYTQKMTRKAMTATVQRRRRSGPALKVRRSCQHRTKYSSNRTGQRIIAEFLTVRARPNTIPDRHKRFRVG